MSLVTIPDRVPTEVIQALTNAALRVYLERHGWRLYDEWTCSDGTVIVGFTRGKTDVAVPGHDRFADHGLRMSQAIGDIVTANNLRSADVIAEMQAIAEWQRRCAEWVEPVGKCDRCWTCRMDGDPNEWPVFLVCPCCENKRCPRATDHHNACSGSNEPGQVGSRYT